MTRNAMTDRVPHCPSVSIGHACPVSHPLGGTRGHGPIRPPTPYSPTRPEGEHRVINTTELHAALAAWAQTIEPEPAEHVRRTLADLARDAAFETITRRLAADTTTDHDPGCICETCWHAHHGTNWQPMRPPQPTTKGTPNRWTPPT